MSMLPPDGSAVAPSSGPPAPDALEKFLRSLSVVTMLMTVPQVVAVWGGGSTAGVSLASWIAYLVSACLWFVYGLRKRDRTIYVACIGWILLDAGIVAGVLVHG